MKTTTERIEKALRRKFHALCAQLDIHEESKREILEAYGCESTLDLTLDELGDVCNKLESKLNPRVEEYDRYRKRVIAAIFAWCKAIGRNDADMSMVKSIACRAAGKKTFNDIPLERLRSLYNAFKNKSKDVAFVHELTMEEISHATLLN